MSRRGVIAVVLGLVSLGILKIAVSALIDAARGDTGDLARDGVVAIGVVLVVIGVALAAGAIVIGRRAWRP